MLILHFFVNTEYIFLFKMKKKQHPIDFIWHVEVHLMGQGSFLGLQAEEFIFNLNQ